MQVQPGVDCDVAATQRVGLTPVEPGNRADLDARASPCGTSLPCPSSTGPALADHTAVTRPDDRFLDQAVTPRKTRYVTHPLLEIVPSLLVSVVGPSLRHSASHGAPTILIVAGLLSRCHAM